MRMEALPALDLMDLALHVFHPPKSNSARTDPPSTRVQAKSLFDVDWVPTNMNVPKGRAKLLILEDNDAVIKMCNKQRSPMMRHVTRTHRVDLDWIFERIHTDKCIRLRYINTKQQIADIFTKGSFTESTWKTLLGLFQISLGKTA